MPRASRFNRSSSLRHRALAMSHRRAATSRDANANATVALAHRNRRPRASAELVAVRPARRAARVSVALVGGRCGDDGRPGAARRRPARHGCNATVIWLTVTSPTFVVTTRTHRRGRRHAQRPTPTCTDAHYRRLSKVRRSRLRLSPPLAHRNPTDD